jgi:UDP-2,3-diacylglucosamine hydrolase
LFDFWHEWKYVVPKGYVRILGKLAELKDSGIDIYFFVGNHDLWMKDYLEEEIGIPVFFEKQYYEVSGKNFLLAHGDGLTPWATTGESAWSGFVPSIPAASTLPSRRTWSRAL